MSADRPARGGERSPDRARDEGRDDAARGDAREARSRDDGPRDADSRITGSTLWTLAACRRRLWLDHHAAEERAAAGDFDLLLAERARRHEEAVRDRFHGLVGPVWRPGVRFEDAAAETLRLLRETRAPLDQPALLSADGRRSGVPDFLYWDGARLVVHDAKLAHRPDDKPGIRLQLTHYARLLDEAGFAGARTEITNGLGEVVEVPPLDDATFRAAVEDAARLVAGEREPDLLLAHSTCEGCGYYARCWDRAEAEERIEILADVHANHVPVLHGLGVRTVTELAARDPESLRIKGFGTLGPAMVLEARAHRDRAAVWLGPAALPAGRPRVWFDFEGDPEDERFGHAVYLWGLAVDHGGRPLAPEAIVADPGESGDENGWRRFVARAGSILDAHPESVWVHYANYERTWVKKYAERWGAPAGFLDRLLPRCLDLYAALREAVRLPLRSYSIKFVAPWVGFRWSNPAADSAWSIVQYARAQAARDQAERRRILDEIARYNADDLEAMRAVWTWIEVNAPRARPAAAGG